MKRGRSTSNDSSLAASIKEKHEITKRRKSDAQDVLAVSHIFRGLVQADGHNLVGCPIIMGSEGSSNVPLSYLLGIIKFYLPKWDMFFIHMYSPEESITQFATLPKALKFVNSRLHLASREGELDNIGVDFSRLSKDRFWLNRADMGTKLQLLADKPLWVRDASVPKGSPAGTSESWKACSECKYLVEDSSPSISCVKCGEFFHSDCLYTYEKLSGPEYDASHLDQQAKEYLSSVANWRLRKTSKNPSLLFEKTEAGDAKAGITRDTSSAFTCNKCRVCRYCCGNVHDEVIPVVASGASSTSIPSIEPFVVCRRCNAASHGWCVFPAVPKLHASVEWECDDCRQCNSCGRVTYLVESTGQPSLLTEWALPSFDQCKQCFAGIDKGEYCPICMRAWTIEWGGDMIECDSCQFWVHVNCDSLSNVDLKQLAHSDVKYNCPICRDDTDVQRRGRVIDLLKAIDKVGLFSEPVSANFLPVYSKVIKHPMDLAKMKTRNTAMMTTSYQNNFEFIKDFELIVENAKVFNMPNSPAYRLAEQFHKQGKYLIEKYLLSNRRGARMIEGLGEGGTGIITTEPIVAGPASNKRQTSLEAKSKWKSLGVAEGKPKKAISYEKALEMIAKDSTSSGDAKKIEPEAPISPYRKKVFGNMLSPTAPPSEPATLAIAPPAAPATDTLLSDQEIRTIVQKILGLASAHFLDQGYGDGGVRSYARPVCVPEGTANITTAIVSHHSSTSPSLLETFRWSLSDCCAVCGGFGESWTFVSCADCAEVFHYYCAGLVDVGFTRDPYGDASNPLGSTTGGKPPFRCRTCSRCRHCSLADSFHDTVMCGLCGCRWHANCLNAKFSENFSFSLSDEYDSGGISVPICEECVLSQSLKFFKSAVCDACDCPLNQAFAQSYLKALPAKDGATVPTHKDEPNGSPIKPEGDTTDVLGDTAMGDGASDVAAPSTSVVSKPSPVVNCLGCGLAWHARCVPEFADLVQTDVAGVYLCQSCVGRWPIELNKKDDSLGENKFLEEYLNGLSASLKEYRSKLFREQTEETVWDVLRTVSGGTISENACVAQNVLANLKNLINIFQSAAGGAVAAGTEDSPVTAPTELSEIARGFLKWALVHKEFIVALGSANENFGKRQKSTLKNLDESSIRIKRLEDEDLLFCQRVWAVVGLLERLVGGADKNMEAVVKGVMSSPHGVAINPPVWPSDLTLSPSVREYLLGSPGEVGARQMQLSLRLKGLDMGYTGPSVSEPGRVFQVPPWETRQCVLCGVLGDHAVLGVLLALSGKWAHRECVEWTVGTVPEIPVRSAPSGINVTPFWSIERVANSSGGETISANPSHITLVDTRIVHKCIQQSMSCSVCGEPRATVRCQQCHLVAFHLGCAVAVNEESLFMDSRCKLLTCGRCLYRSPELGKMLQNQFAQSKASWKWTQGSIQNQLDTLNRQVGLVRLVDQDTSIAGCFREGNLTILSPGSFASDFVYDGSPEITPDREFVSIRLFFPVEVSLSKSDENFFEFKNSDIPLLRRKQKVAYLNRIRAPNASCTIEILGGRVVAVGTSVESCFAEFQNTLVSSNSYRFPSHMTGRFWFGLNSQCMQTHLASVALKSVKKQASARRSEWLYHPQLRPAVSAALGIRAGDLTTLTSFRRRIGDIDQGSIDNLKSLGRIEPSELRHNTPPLLEPALVTRIAVGPPVDSATTKSARIVSLQISTAVDSANPATRYRLRTCVPDLEVLEVRRSKIHNYGLFAGPKGFAKNDFVVEYQGEVLRETVADEREKKAERAGNGDGGSCYMFRLDEEYVVDATVKGNCARFINHSCQANCACKMIEDEQKKKHIMIIAKKDIAPGEEITYDYQFAVESEKLACLCGAPNCLGRLN